MEFIYFRRPATGLFNIEYPYLPPLLKKKGNILSSFWK